MSVSSLGDVQEISEARADDGVGDRVEDKSPKFEDLRRDLRDAWRIGAFRRLPSRRVRAAEGRSPIVLGLRHEVIDERDRHQS